MKDGGNFAKRERAKKRQGYNGKRESERGRLKNVTIKKKKTSSERQRWKEESERERERERERDIYIQSDRQIERVAWRKVWKRFIRVLHHESLDPTKLKQLQLQLQTDGQTNRVETLPRTDPILFIPILITR